MSPDLLAFLKWYLAVLVVGLLAWPLAFKFFRHLPDRGYAFAKPLGLLTIGYVFWMLGSLGFLRNDVPGMLFAAAVVGGLGLGWLGRAGVSELWTWLREQRAAVLAVELLFLAAFVLMALVRAYNPEINGTEKPMEFMFINSILRSPTFPPHDAWLSGHVISYYYFGYVMVASLAQLTGTASSVAFNLGLALLFALTATGAAGVVMNLIALVKKDDPRAFIESRRERGGEGGTLRVQAELTHTPHPSPPRSLLVSSTTGGAIAEARGSSFSLLPSFWPALLGPLLVLVVGNFYGPLALAHGNGMFADLNVPVIRYSFGVLPDPNNPASPQAFADPPGLKVGPINFWDWLDLKELKSPPPAKPGAFSWGLGPWFFAARVVHDRNLTGAETEAIDEMPAFSFLLGDMHPHVLALPFVIMAVALALEWLLAASGSAELPITNYPLLVTPDRLILSALLLGGLSFLNTWDFPIYGFLTALAFAAGLGLRWGWENLLNSWRPLALTALVLAVLSVLLYLPFYLTLQSQAGGFLPNLIYPTRFQQTVVFFGPVLIGMAVFLGWLTVKGRSALDRPAALWAGGGIVVLLILIVAALTLGASLNPQISEFADQAVAPLTRNQAIGLMFQRRLVDSLATLFPAAAIALAVGLGVGWLRQTEAESAPLEAEGESPAPEKPRPWRRRPTISNLQSPSLRSPAVFMALAMIVTGALLMLGPEYMYLRDNFGSRMNTLFKFYFQTWSLWALVSAFGLWYVMRRAGRAGRWVSAGVMSLAVVGGLLYTLPALNTKTGGFAGPPTLDGMAYFAKDSPDDWAAIQWLQQNVKGAPVILEGTKGAYWVEGRSSRISMATGLPTILGWANHEGQWRGKYFERVSQREDQIRTLYQVRDWKTAEQLLDLYHVEYVVVSHWEQDWYKPSYFRKFEQYMQPVFHSGDVTLYRRIQAQP